jgi:hypothetical protein
MLGLAMASAEVTLEAVPRRPRVWPTLLVLLVALPAAAIVAGCAVVAGALLDGVALTESRALERWAEEIAGSPRALLFLVLPAELCFLAAAPVPALLSPRSLRERLALDVPRATAGTLGLCLAGTLGLQFAVTLAAEALISEPSASLEFLTRLIVAPRGIHGWLLVLTLSALPALAEELLFRGYAQSRLAAAWGGWRGLLLPTLFFALAHFDLQHSLAILPLGLWFGFVAWRTGSTWSAILCHGCNNLVGLTLARLGGSDEELLLRAQPLYLAATVLGALALGLAVRTLARGRDRTRLGPGR